MVIVIVTRVAFVCSCEEQRFSALLVVVCVTLLLLLLVNK